MRTLAHISRDQSRWLRALTYERVDGLVTNNRWAEWADHVAPDRADFLSVDGYDVLLPVEARHHPHITVVRSMVSVDRETLALLVKDTTYAAEGDLDPEDVWVAYVALCVRVPDADWYVAILYHETLLDPDGPLP